MIVMQAGWVESFAFIAIMVLAVAGISYFLALPILVFWKETRAWRKRYRILLSATYFGLLSTSIIFISLPDYYVPPYLQDMFILLFLFLPAIYIGIVGFINLIKKLISKKNPHGDVVTVEGCNHPSGCKVGETEK